MQQVCSQRSRPNVVIINFDDMGYGDVEPFGLTGINTPNFNKLAAQGMRLTNFNAAQPVCSASRAALLTGCYPNRIGVTGALLPESKYALNPEEETLAELLHNNGYATGMFGKWHLGNKPPYFPKQNGFDEFYGLPYSHDIWPVDYSGKKITEQDNYRGRWPALPVIEGDIQVDTISSLQEQEQWTTSITEHAVSFIKTQKLKPFFLYVAHPLPHVPLVVGRNFKDKGGNGIFSDVITELDWSLGQIMNALDDSGAAGNTILIVTSDNGP